ncbi:hypothetical protein ACWCRD_09530 [Streptomyces sp. NPDC002092]
MPDEHVSILQSLGVAVLAFAAVVWVLGLLGVVRRGRTPYVLPQQRQAPPHRESVELTPAERAAFAGLVRQLGDGR